MCNFPDCNRPSRHAGYCNTHSCQRQRTGEMWPIGSERSLIRVRRTGACLHSGCQRPLAAKGYCQRHYNQFRRYGETYDVVGYGKQNARCKIAGCSNLAVDFCVEHTLEGRGECDVEGCGEARRSIRNKFCDPHAREDRRVRHFYGIDIHTYLGMRKAQQGLCAICRQGAARHLDHCHTSGKPRGFLCGSCNRALGLFADDPEVLRAAADYLERQVEPCGAVG